MLSVPILVCNLCRRTLWKVNFRIAVRSFYTNRPPPKQRWYFTFWECWLRNFPRALLPLLFLKRTKKGAASITVADNHIHFIYSIIDLSFQVPFGNVSGLFRSLLYLTVNTYRGTRATHCYPLQSYPPEAFKLAFTISTTKKTVPCCGLAKLTY